MMFVGDINQAPCQLPLIVRFRCPMCETEHVGMGIRVECHSDNPGHRIYRWRVHVAEPTLTIKISIGDDKVTGWAHFPKRGGGE